MSDSKKKIALLLRRRDTLLYKIASIDAVIRKYEADVSLDCNKVEQVVIEITGVPVDKLKSVSMEKDVVYSRYLIWHICMKHYDYTFQYLGFIYNRHHTTVMNGVKTMQGFIDVGGKYPADMIPVIEKKLNID